MSQRTEVSEVLVQMIKKRIRLNIRARILDNIVVRLQRSSFTDHTGKARIEDTSIAHIADVIRQQRWVWDGKDNGQNFTITVPVAKMFTEFDSLADLTEWTAKDGGFLPTRAPLNKTQGK